MPLDSPFDVYREQLTALSHGLALWNPKPPKHIYNNVSIGDVGYLQKGTFIRMFNVMLPWDHPSNRKLGHPEPYESLDCGQFANTLEDHFDRVEHYSRYVSAKTNAGNLQAMTPDDTKGVTYRFRNRGALLSLPNGGHREDVIRTKAFENYIRDHIVSWFNWAQNNKLGVECMEDLILVSGCTLVTSWAAAAFVDNTSTEAEISLESRALGDSRASFVWSNNCGPVVYHNSRFDPQNPPTTRDQCVFIRGFRAKRVLFWTRRIRAAAEPLPDDPDNRRDDEKRVTRVPGFLKRVLFWTRRTRTAEEPPPGNPDNRRDDEIQVTQVPGVLEYRDPLIGVLDYIAEKCLEDAISEDTIAIAHDNDLQLIEDLEIPTADAVEKFLREKQMPLIVENGAAILRDPRNNDPPVSDEKKYAATLTQGRFNQYPQGGYVTPASGSSRSNSTSSLCPSSVHGTPIVLFPLVPSKSRYKTSDDLPTKPPAPIKAWQASASTSASGSSTYGPEPILPRTQARAPRFHMHPLLSYTRLHHAPISYDIAFTPSARTVVDRMVDSPLPAVTLAQPATEPPIPASSRLVLRSPKLPWVVVVGPIGSPETFITGKDGEKRKVKTSAALTNLDVLYAVHSTLMTCATPEEWDSLGESSRAQRRIAEAYRERCTRMGGGWEGGVRRLDWLGSKTHLVGVEIDKSNETGENTGRLVFGRPSASGAVTQ